jgi:hypothetical protein
VKNLRSTLHHLFHPKRSNNHRPRVLHPKAYLYYTGLLAVFFVVLHSWQFSPDSFQSVLGFASNITGGQVIDQTNQERKLAGLGSVTLNTQLSEAALAKGQDMMNDQYWAHVAPDGKQPWSFITESGYTYQVAGENLARDFADTSSMTKAWMESPTHRANILNPKYQEIGIAVIDGKLLGYETTLVVQMFGSPAQGSPTVGVRGVSQDADGKVAVANPETNLNNADSKPVGAKPAVLSSSLVPIGNYTKPPLFTPLEMSKAFFLSLIMMIVGTLIYDGYVIGHQSATRMVGKNLAHIIFLTAIAYLLIYFKAGLVG